MNRTLTGLNFWVNQIESCGADAQCRAVKRINVSAAFFLSIEFQNTGYFVERMYKAGFGDIAPPTVPVPVRFTNFLADSQEIRGNIIVAPGQLATTDRGRQESVCAGICATHRICKSLSGDTPAPRRSLIR